MKKEMRVSTKLAIGLSFIGVLLIISLKTSLSVIFCKISILSVMKTPWFNNEAKVLVKFDISL